ncbi:hypothetical protein RAM19_05955 [Bartonella apihabitans]|uniref:hypothetical protein n=1 Tax=uncultured Bartonella sp. TaxID=104108 RepID=UPI0025EFBE3A|nr:hypothetical protein [Bartonella apihabitans]WLT09673.1 hypothetical protein RAM19_05955 [Bartonella apihabitans]
MRVESSPVRPDCATASLIMSLIWDAISVLTPAAMADLIVHSTPLPPPSKPPAIA